MIYKGCDKCDQLFATDTNLKIHQASCLGKDKRAPNTGVPHEEEEKPKCVYKGLHGEETNGHCTHPPEEHHEGTCWHIVKPELADKPTYSKYCDCAISEDAIKSWSSLEHYEGKGWMEPKRCLDCDGEGIIIVCRDPKTKIGKEKQCPTCDGKGTVDLMITMECENCKKVALIRTDVKHCIHCEKNQPEPRNFFTGRLIA